MNEDALIAFFLDYEDEDGADPSPGEWSPTPLGQEGTG